MPFFIISGSSVNLPSWLIRLGIEASRLGKVRARVCSDNGVQAFQASPPEFSLAKMMCSLQVIRCVDLVALLAQLVSPNTHSEKATVCIAYEA
jgi:hypothetical protein